MKIEFLWFEDCPNHQDARALLRTVMADRRLTNVIEEIDATESSVAERHRFPGSPTIRINGRDVEPGFHDPGDYTPRCRLYQAAAGLKGVPERRWIENALTDAQRAEDGAA